MQTPENMNAIVAEGKGGPEVMRIASVPVPTLKSGEVLVNVAAAGINRPDVLQRQGLYPAPKGHSEILGLEVSGTVAAVGADCTTLKAGDAVLALVNGGGYAEYVAVAESCCIKKPDTLSVIEAAAIPETFFTVWHNVFERGALKPGETFLVHGGAGGIGVTAIQLAKAFGARVFATVGSQAKCDAVRALGADIAIDYRKDDFSAVIKKETAGRGVDVILDVVGGDYIDKNLRSLAEDGRLVNIAYLQGSTATIDFMRVMLKRLTITGSTLRARSDDFKAGLARTVEQKALPLIVSGKIKVPVDSTFPLADAAKAHAHMESSAHVGKIVLTM